jgi:hypothetical protein
MFLDLLDPDPDPLVRGVDSDPDPYQNVTDPQHCVSLSCDCPLFFRFRNLLAGAGLEAAEVPQESYLLLKKFIIAAEISFIIYGFRTFSTDIKAIYCFKTPVSEGYRGRGFLA